MWIQIMNGEKYIGNIVADTYIIKPYGTITGARYIFMLDGKQIAYMEGILTGVHGDFVFEV